VDNRTGEPPRRSAEAAMKLHAKARSRLVEVLPPPNPRDPRREPLPSASVRARAVVADLRGIGDALLGGQGDDDDRETESMSVTLELSAPTYALLQEAGQRMSRESGATMPDDTVLAFLVLTYLGDARHGEPGGPTDAPAE
jgi:hypothetical protein